MTTPFRAGAVRVVRVASFLLCLGSSGALRAQNAAGIAPASPPPAELSPAQQADFAQRFQQGLALKEAGKLPEALAVFQGILAQAPEAKGSLREAGFLCVKLGLLPQAATYLDRLHRLVPDYPGALEALIQVDQALGRDVKVIFLVQDYRELHAAGKVPRDYFVRERIHLEKGSEIVMTEFFDYRLEPNTVWMAELFDATGQLLRRVLLNYDPEATKTLHAKDPTDTKSEVFLVLEQVIREQRIRQVNGYTQFFRLARLPKSARHSARNHRQITHAGLQRAGRRAALKTGRIHFHPKIIKRFLLHEGLRQCIFLST